MSRPQVCDRGLGNAALQAVLDSYLLKHLSAMQLAVLRTTCRQATLNLSSSAWYGAPWQCMVLHSGHDRDVCDASGACMQEMPSKAQVS